MYVVVIVSVCVCVCVCGAGAGDWSGWLVDRYECGWLVVCWRVSLVLQLLMLACLWCWCGPRAGHDIT